MLHATWGHKTISAERLRWWFIKKIPPSLPGVTLFILPELLEMVKIIISDSFKPLDLNNDEGTSLVTQWMRIRLSLQETQVQALVQEDSTCGKATKSVHHNYWACALKPRSRSYSAHVPKRLKPLHSRACALQQQKPTAMRSPRTAAGE